MQYVRQYSAYKDLNVVLLKNCFLSRNSSYIHVNNTFHIITVSIVFISCLRFFVRTLSPFCVAKNLSCRYVSK